MWSVVESEGGWSVLWGDQSVGCEKPTYEDAVGYEQRLRQRYPDGAGVELMCNASQRGKRGGPYRIRFADGTSEVLDLQSKAEVRDVLLRRFGKMVKDELVPAKRLPHGTKIVPV